MPRLPTKPHRDPLAEARAAVEQLAGSPLDPIAQGLTDALDIASGAHSSDAITEAELVRICEYVTTVVGSLPKSFGDRFWFDAGLIRAMSTDWSDQRLFSQMIVPCCGSQWGYSRIPMPLNKELSRSGTPQVQVIDVIFLPKSDDLTQIALLDYPWIAHELAHSLMFRNDDLLIPLINPPVAEAMSRRRLAAIADRGRARAISHSALEEFNQFWLPTVDHRNWAHELTADLIAAWVLGPAFLATFEDLLGHGNQNPYQVSTIHPPYSVRATALLEAARQIGFVQHARELEKLLDSWESSGWNSQKTNRYRSLADKDTIHGLIGGAFQFCEKLCLRKWSNDVVSAPGASNVPELGTDLLITAWLAFNREGQANYERWESQVIQTISSSLRS